MLEKWNNSNRVLTFKSKYTTGIIPFFQKKVVPISTTHDDIKSIFFCSLLHVLVIFSVPRSLELLIKPILSCKKKSLQYLKYLLH